MENEITKVQLRKFIRENPAMVYEDNNTWEMMTIVEEFERQTKNMDKYSKEYETAKEEFAQMLRIQVLNFGLIMTIDEFIESVETGSLVSYDGSGELLEKDGKKSGERVRFDVDWLKAQKDKYKYVCWYNK